MKLETTLNISWQCIDNKVFIIHEPSNRVYCLEKLSYYLWNCIVKQIEEDEIVKKVSETYEITKEIAQKDISDFIDEMVKLGFLRRCYD